MRDGNTVGLGQRVGVGIWLALGATLAFLAVQTVLVTAEATIVTDLGAPSEAGLDSDSAESAPILPVAALAAECGSGSECADGTTTNGTTTNGTTETSSGEEPTEESTAETAVTPAEIPPDGEALACPAVGISGSVEITDAVAPCSDAIEALKATCSFNVSTLGYGDESEELSGTAPAERGQSVDVSASARDVETMEGAVLEQYDCPGGETLTTRRGVYVE